MAEFSLRTVLPPSQGYATLPPGAEWTLNPSPDVIHGVAGVSRVRVNRFGVRGRLFGDDRAEFRILAVGGSTTLCRALDDTEVWTHLVESDLGRTVDGRAVWVGNVGRDGSTSRDHVLQIKYLLHQYPRVDVVVSLVGVNDLLSALQQGWHYRISLPVTEPGAEHDQMQRAFAQFPGRLQDQARYVPGPVPWYRATALWQLGRRAKLALGRRHAVALRNAGMRSLQSARLERQHAAAWIDSLPPLDAPLIEYRRNLNAMADLAADAGVRLVLVTQPSAWRDGMPGAAERLLLMGALAGGRGYYTARVLGRAMAQYNETLLAVCRSRALECVDAAHVIPRDTTALYDDVHFNERGSRLLADTLAGYFRARAPFRRATARP